MGTEFSRPTVTFLGCEDRLTYCLYPLALCTVTISTLGLGGCSDARRPWSWAVSRTDTVPVGWNPRMSGEQSPDHPEVLL